MSDTSTPSPQLGSRPVLIGAAIVAAVLVAGTVVLWAHYGSAVFYEMILAGISACF